MCGWVAVWEWLCGICWCTVYLSGWCLNLIIFFKDLFLCARASVRVRVCVCACTRVHTHACLQRPEEGNGSHIAGILDGCEPPNLGSKNLTWIVCKSSKCPSLSQRSCLSALFIYFKMASSCSLWRLSSLTYLTDEPAWSAGLLLLTQHWSCRSCYCTRVCHTVAGDLNSGLMLTEQYSAHRTTVLVPFSLKHWKHLLLYISTFICISWNRVICLRACLCTASVQCLETRFHFCELSSDLHLSAGTHAHVYIYVCACAHTHNK